MTDKAGRTPLHYAALSGDAQKVDAAIKMGFDVDAADNQGFTPLHLAAQSNSVSAVEMLLKEGAPVNAKNIYGNGPLFVAVFYSAGDGQVIRMLREHGADPTAVNDSGQSALGLSRLIANYNVAQFFEDLP